MQTDLTLDTATAETLVAAATAAPSIHNTQPWRFRLDRDSRTVEVHAAWERALPLADPDGRALHVSVGATVFNLRVATAHLGWEPVLRLLPTSSDPGHLASVRLAGPPRTGAAGGPDLYPSIARRHSSRLPFTGEQVPGAVMAELFEAAGAEGAVLTAPGPTESARLLALTTDAELRRTAARDRLEETRSWLKDSNEGPYGIPYEVLGPRDAQARVPMRDFTGLERGRNVPPPQRFEPRPRLLLLSTAADRPADWLRAGMALEHVLLLLTAHGLRASLLYQALEWQDLRWLLRDPGSSGAGSPQMVLRVGYGPEGPVTPRRPVAEVLAESGRDRLPR
ncbi:nitroreductase family protein [Streptomyces sp. 846.5]|nr:nitroreductase family protein [Streptomyces sp. 846.5]TDT97380.1 nitroreductase family protein [Streptomyces sp. 846.5]